MIAKILDEDGDLAAAPALRLSAYLPVGALALPGGQAFLSRLESDVLPMVENVAGPPFVTKHGVVPRKPAHWKKASETWRSTPSGYRESAALMYGPINGYSSDLPFAAIHEQADGVIVDVAVTSAFALDAVLSGLWEPLVALKPAFAICGWGMAPDPSEGAEARWMHALRAKRRYQMAWCMHAEAVAACMVARKVANYNEKKQGNARPGIPDIGWKTVIGGEFLGEIDQAALAKIEGVKLRKLGGAIEITIGDAPRWGDVNAGEDVSSYAAVCRALAPIQMSKSMLCNRGTFGDADDVTEVIEAYYRLWEV